MNMKLYIFKKNNVWINFFNRVFAFCFRSNYDIFWILTVAKSLSVMYYIINYAIKNDFNFNQILLKLTLIKKIFEKSKKKNQKFFQLINISFFSQIKFALRCFNALIHDRKISFVQIANFFFDFDFFFIKNKNFYWLNFNFLRVHVKRIITKELFAVEKNDNNVIENDSSLITSDF